MANTKEGILQMQPSGRWAVCQPGHAPVEIRSGELFRVEVGGELMVTRMEFQQGQPGEYYSVDGYRLLNGLRAARVAAPTMEPWGRRDASAASSIISTAPTLQPASESGVPTDKKALGSLTYRQEAGLRSTRVIISSASSH
jgi:hypothetical protein